MQLEYRDEKVRRILCDAKTLQRKVGLEIGRKVKQKLNQLEASNNLNEYLTKLRFGNPHPLSGSLNKCFGISITANYRIVIEPLETNLDIESLKECKKIDIKGVLDYHGGKNEWIIP